MTRCLDSYLVLVFIELNTAVNKTVIVELIKLNTAVNGTLGSNTRLFLLTVYTVTESENPVQKINGRDLFLRSRPKSISYIRCATFLCLYDTGSKSVVKASTKSGEHVSHVYKANIKKTIHFCNLKRQVDITASKLLLLVVGNSNF